MTKKDLGARARIAILGASGYTGGELIRLLARHDGVTLTALTANAQAGKKLGDVFPHLAQLDLPILSRIEDVDWTAIDLVFAALPHGMTQSVLAGLPSHLKLIDLSADFRLQDERVYAAWYGHEHQALALQKEAIYGLTERNRAFIAKARLIANPGCYPTSIILPLAPLLEAGLIEVDTIIADAKSGVSGAGRDAKQGSLYTEVTEGIHAYGIATHRHAPEIEQELDVSLTFTPHLMPMSRGILSTIYVRLKNGATAESLRKALAATYDGERFVKLLPEGVAPATRHVRGSNYCLMNVFADRIAGRAIIVSVIDNLIKGAAGQAIQNMNLMLGLPESQGLEQEPLFP